jgi:hypothetical protein
MLTLETLPLTAQAPTVQLADWPCWMLLCMLCRLMHRVGGAAA